MPRKRKQSAKAKQHAALTRHHRQFYDQYVVIQGGEFCALCGRPPKVGGRRLAIDHDHRDMSVRGLLCGMCNRRLRWYLVPDWLRKAADYLEHPPLKEGAAFAAPPEISTSTAGVSLSPRPTIADPEEVWENEGGN